MLYMQRFFILSTFGSSGIPFYQGVISNYMLIKPLAERGLNVKLQYTLYL